MKNIFLFSLLLLSVPSFARSAGSSHPTLTYDLGGGSGTYNGTSYSEVNLGLSWYLGDYLIWRNQLFSRFAAGTETRSGVDSSARFNYSIDAEESSLGLSLYAGPGIRVSDSENSGIFGEAGVTFRAAGLSLGLGVKQLQYSNPGKNPDGTDRSKSDASVFIILGGGGSI